MPTASLTNLNIDQGNVASDASASNAEKARALMAMLEPGATAPAGVSPDRLRDWANDLIRTVEKGRAKESAPPAPRRRLFSKAPPTLKPASARPLPDMQPSRLTLTVPVPHALAGPAPTVQTRSSASYAPEQVRKIVASTIDEKTLMREHPAVIAMTLLERTSLDQAKTLRSLPGGQVRAVHRALRQLEFDRPAPRTAVRGPAMLSG